MDAPASDPQLALHRTDTKVRPRRIAGLSSRRPVASMARLAALVLFAGGCASAQDREWTTTIALDTGTKLGGCAIGDLNTPIPGEEIVAVAGDGKVWLASWDGTEFEAHILDELPGEMIQCAIGNLDSVRRGDEIVVVGMLEGSEDDVGRGAAWSFDPTPSGYKRVKLLEGDALFHAVCIGDIDPLRDGNECLIAGYAPEVQLVWREGGAYTSRVVGTLDGPAKGAAAGPGRAVIACADGRLIEITAPTDAAGDWKQAEIARFDTPLARVALSPDGVLVSANDGQLRYVGSDGSVQTLLQSSDRLRGAVIADLHPGHPGAEWATAGYDGTVRMVWGAPGRRGEQVVGRDTDRYHHLASGSLTGLGTVLVGSGYSGRLTVFAAPN